MTHAEQWASNMSNAVGAVQAVKAARPVFSAPLEAVKGAQEAGAAEVAFLIAVDGKPFLQLRNKILTPEQALALAAFAQQEFIGPGGALLDPDPLPACVK